MSNGSSSAKKIIVLGGGISGLTAAKALESLGQDCLLLEQCPTLGGLTRTVEVGDFCFDYTGHFLHLCRHKSPADIPYAGLKDEDWQKVSRRSVCFVSGRMVDAPIQYNLGQLPPSELSECVKSYDERPAHTGSEPPTFRDFIIRGFGKYLADLFLIPQNEKTMAISLDQLSSRAVRRFFPPPNEVLVRAGIRGEALAAAEYNSFFWYPKSGGIGALVKGLSAGLNGVRTNQVAKMMDLPNRTLHTATGESIRWDTLFSSVPLKLLCQISNIPELRSTGEELSHSSTVSFNIGVQGNLRPEFENVHWIYVPDRSIPFYRVGFYSSISKGTCTPGNSSIYAEVGVSSECLDSAEIVQNLQPKVLASLEELGWIESRRITCVVVHVIRCAYVHHTERRDSLVDRILARLAEFGVHPIGRYGLWDYTSMEDSMQSAISAVQNFL